MTDKTAATDDQALDWVIRLRDPGFDGWEAFEAWLAADPAHADAYQAMAVADADAAAMVARAPAPAAKRVAAPARRRIPTRRWFGGAIAASLAFAAGLAVFERRGEPYLVETAAGAPRSLVLADGTRLDLNGGTRIALDRRHPREAVLERGEVTFSVVHDDRRPFAVAVGDARLVDVGTVFNVVREAGVTDVGVVEGAIVFNPAREAVKLSAGHGLRAIDGTGKVVLSTRTAADIGAWRTGQLVYAGQPLADIAADLTRNLGIPVTVAADLAGRPFHGVISLGTRDPDRVMPGLAAVLDVHVDRQAAGWRLTKAKA